eukprot:9086967-Pyramimonas_sp.AAC.1
MRRRRRRRRMQTRRRRRRHRRSHFLAAMLLEGCPSGVQDGLLGFEVLEAATGLYVPLDPSAE